MVRNVQTIILSGLLSEPSRKQLVAGLKGCRTGQNHIRSDIPEHWVIRDKTGINGKDAAGDMAVIWPKPDTAITVSIYVGIPISEQIKGLFSKAACFIAQNIL